MTTVLMPTPGWQVLAQRFGTGLEDRERELWRLSGLDEEYGPAGDGFTGTRAVKEMTDELTGLLLGAIVWDMEAQQSRRGVGRPTNVMIPYLGPSLLSFFLRCHNSAGRKSVLTSIGGQLAQMEVGALFEFVRTTIEPLNAYLAEVHRKPLSAARLARYALAERRKTLRAGRRP